MLAIVFAIGLAFAMEANTVTQTGYYDDPLIPGIQSVTIGDECRKQLSGTICEFDGHQLYAEATLSNLLRKNP